MNWEQFFRQMAELTAGAENITQVAQRAIDAKLVDANHPHGTAWGWANEADAFFAELADALWDPAKEPLWESGGDHGRQ
jgi:hypothetical protein